MTVSGDQKDIEKPAAAEGPAGPAAPLPPVAEAQAEPQISASPPSDSGPEAKPAAPAGPPPPATDSKAKPAAAKPAAPPKLRAVADAGAAPARPRTPAQAAAAAELIARVRATAKPVEGMAGQGMAAPVSSAPVIPASPVAAAVALPPASPASQPSGKPPTVIGIRDLSLTFQTNDGPVQALSGIDLSVARGEFVSLIGPSGCGKTTLLRVIADLEKASGGSISVNGMTPEEARLNRAYGYVFQAPALYPWRTIARNVALPLEIMGLGRAERERRVAENLALVNLTGFERKFPWQLSGGMQQRVSIARALSVQPDLLLMDEPFGALDEIVRDHLNEQLLQLWSKTNKTVIFVTHSIPEAVFLSTRIVVMTPRPGKIYDVIESGLPRGRTLDIRETPEFLKVAHRVREGLRAGHSYDD